MDSRGVQGAAAVLIAFVGGTLMGGVLFSSQLSDSGTVGGGGQHVVGEVDPAWLASGKEADDPVYSQVSAQNLADMGLAAPGGGGGRPPPPVATGDPPPATTEAPPPADIAGAAVLVATEAPPMQPRPAQPDDWNAVRAAPAAVFVRVARALGLAARLRGQDRRGRARTSCEAGNRARRHTHTRAPRVHTAPRPHSRPRCTTVHL